MTKRIKQKTWARIIKRKRIQTPSRWWCNYNVWITFKVDSVRLRAWLRFFPCLKRKRQPHAHLEMLHYRSHYHSLAKNSDCNRYIFLNRKNCLISSWAFFTLLWCDTFAPWFSKTFMTSKRPSLAATIIAVWPFCMQISHTPNLSIDVHQLHPSATTMKRETGQKLYTKPDLWRLLGVRLALAASRLTVWEKFGRFQGLVK